MLKLRVKLDVWSQGLDESLRQRNRLLLIQSYLRLPPRRVWFFVEYARFAILDQAEDLKIKSDLFDYASAHGEEPEDTIAKGKCLFFMFVYKNIDRNSFSYYQDRQASSAYV